MLLISVCQTAIADTFTIREFGVSTAGTDLFNDGIPPEGPTGPATYNTAGTFGPEVNNPGGPGADTAMGD